MGRRLICEPSCRQVVALFYDESTPILARLSRFGMF